MSPYREAPPVEERARPPEELAIYVATLCAGIVPVALALIRGGAFGSSATVGAIACVLAVAGLARQVS